MSILLAEFGTSSKRQSLEKEKLLRLYLGLTRDYFLVMGALQAEIERRGERIFDLVDRHPEPLFSKAGFYQRMMALSMRDEHFKVQLFRFVDVLASLHRGTDIVQHLDEYFADMRNGYAPLIRTFARGARIVPWISGQLLRWNVSGMARQFIAGRNPKDVMKML